MAMDDAIRTYSCFVEDVLKPQLKESLRKRDEILAEQQEYKELQVLLKELQQSTTNSMHTLLDIGEKFKVRAKIPDTSMVVIDIGLHFHVEMTLEEAEAFVEQHLRQLETKRKQWQEKATEVSNHVNLVLEAIQQLVLMGK